MHLRPDAKVPRASVVLRSFLCHSIMKSWLYWIHFNYEGCSHPLAEDSVSGCRVRMGTRKQKCHLPCICRSRLKWHHGTPLVTLHELQSEERQRQGITGASWVRKEEVWGEGMCLHDTKDNWSHSLLNVHFLRAKGFVSSLGSPRTQPGTSPELSKYLLNE